MTRKPRPVGGRKEASLVVVGRDNVVLQQSPQEQVYTSKDTEYQYYSELLNGFFDVLTGLQNVFGQYSKPSHNSGFNIPHYSSSDKYNELLSFQVDVKSVFYIVQTPKDLKRVPQLPGIDRSPNPDLVAAMEIAHEQTGHFKNAKAIKMRFLQSHSEEEKRLIVDLDGVRPLEVEVTICDIPDRLAVKYLEVTASHLLPATSRKVRYVLEQDNLKISRGYAGYHDPMTDVYATHLLSNIHSLLLDSTSPNQQPDRRASQGTLNPKVRRQARRKQSPG